MIILYTLPPAFGLRNPSPFCLKAEMALSTLGLEFETRHEGDPRKAPKGKLPFLVDGEVLPDSELILDHLDNKTKGGLFGSLTQRERSVGLAFTRLAEDHLYWLMVAARWLDDDWFGHVRRDFFGNLPGPMTTIASGLARRQVRQTLHLHGLGRHSLEQQAGFARRDLEAIAGQTGAEGYIAGERLTVFDYAVAGILAGLMDNQPATWISLIANDIEPLRTYIERVQSETGIYCRPNA